MAREGSSNSKMSTSYDSVSTPDQPSLSQLKSTYYSPSQVANHGFYNGILGIESGHFNQFIEASEKRERLIAYRESILAKQAKIENDLVTLKNRKLKYESEQISRGNELQELESRRLRLNKKQEQKEKQIDIVTKNRDGLEIPYGLLATLLYFAGGLVFMTTDYSIAKGVAIKGFDMGDSMNFFFHFSEAQIFALGMSTLAIVLKPLIDRAFEQPYLQKTRRNQMFWLLGVVSILAIVALAAMGSFRTTARAVDGQKKGLGKRIEALKDAPEDGILSDDQLAELQELTIERESTSQILINGEVRIIFMLSSILFAIAGAICLSISIPSLRLHSQRIWTSLKISRLRFIKWLRALQISYLTQRKTRVTTKQDIAHSRLPKSEEERAAQDEIESLRKEEQNVLEAIYELHTQAQQAWYCDNYDRGNQFQTVGQGKSFRINLMEGERVISSRIVQRPRGGKTGQNKFYLYQELRRIINSKATGHKQPSHNNGQHS